MHDHLIEIIRQLKPTELSNNELKTFINQAVEKISEDGYDKNSSVYRDDLLLYYVLGQLALYEGDLAEYSNYCILFNNAASSFHRLSFEQSPSIYPDGHFRHPW